MKVIVCKNCGTPYYDDLKGCKEFFCERCKYHTKVLDISYKDEVSAPLSNLFPHKFEIDNIVCLSMESFIQSLRVKEKSLQIKICSDYSGYMAYKMRSALPDWRSTGKVYWQGKPITRNSKEYENLITKAYDCLLENDVFRFSLNSFKDYYLFHSIGSNNENETLLTEDEYISQLNRLINKLY